MAGSKIRSRVFSGAAALAVILPALGANTVVATVPTEPISGAETHADPTFIDPAAPITVAGMVEVNKPVDPASYDGVANTVDQTPDVTSGTKRAPGLPTFHAIYAYPKDGQNRFKDLAAMFQQDLREASDLLNQAYGYALRIDERASDAGPMMVDITSVQLTATNADLDAVRANEFPLPSLFSTVKAELTGKGFTNPDKKYIVWLDSPQPDYCGQATREPDEERIASNRNQASSYALIYRPGSLTGAGGGFCRSATVLHEVGHALGALLPRAPNHFDGAHCADAENDIMCYPYFARLHTGAPDAEEDPTGYASTLAANAVKHEYRFRDAGPPTAVFDHNNDDYWDPAANPALGSTATLTWWTANLNRFLCPPAGCTVANEPFNNNGRKRPRR